MRGRPNKHSSNRLNLSPLCLLNRILRQRFSVIVFGVSEMKLLQINYAMKRFNARVRAYVHRMIPGYDFCWPFVRARHLHVYSFIGNRTACRGSETTMQAEESRTCSIVVMICHCGV